MAESDSQNPAGSEDNAEDTLTALSQVLLDLEQHPDNVILIRNQIRLMLVLGMTAEVLDAYDRLSSLIMLDEATWLSYFDLRLSSCALPLSLDAFLEISEKFTLAEQDYISIAVLARHINFVIHCFHAGVSGNASNEGPALAVDSEVKEFLTADTARSMIKALYERGQGMLSGSHQLWQLWLQWELDLLKNASDKTSTLDQIHLMFSERMAVPHTNFDQTSSAYSSFCSQYCQEEYEARMVQSTEASRPAKMKLSEKRYGRTRNDFEEQISYATDDNARTQILTEYAAWESDSRARNNTRGKGPQHDQHLTKSVYERAVAQYAKAMNPSHMALDAAVDSLKHREHQSENQGKGDHDKDHSAIDAIHEQVRVAGEAVRAYKDAEASLWSKYAGWALDTLSLDSANHIWSRAARACPQNGDIWVNLLLNEVRKITAIFEKSLALGLLSAPNDRTSDLASVFICRAAYETRLEPPENVQASLHPVMVTIMRGLDLVSRVNKSGDVSLKMEKFLLSWAETRALDYLDQVLEIIGKPNKARSSSYQMVLLHTDVLSRHGQIEDARQIFLKAIHRSDLDWPEAVYDALIQFELVHGTLDSLFDARSTIDKEKDKLLKRREKVAMDQQQYMISADGTDAVADSASQPVAEQVEAIIDPTHNTSNEKDQNFKRDREHTTILLSGLPKGVSPDRVNSLFSDCGAVRETTILADSDSMFDAALVEFSNVDAVPLALQKDRRKIDGNETSVSMLWRSTLFVTNFAPDIDDAALRQLFGQYGRILQIRWPSRKYANNRRFCYVTMESPAAAQEALILHGYKTGTEGFSMNVLISDPSAKSQRSDVGNATLFIGGLNDRTTEADVRTLLQGCGTIRHIKLGWDPARKICRGFAFVDMASESDANACLPLNGTSYQKKFLKVQISDPNFANKKAKDRKPDQAAERRDRLITLANLPEKTQEGLLHQALEKIIPVRRLEVFAKTHEAVAELDSSQDVGKLLLRSEPFIFEGNEIQFSTQRSRTTAATSTPNTSEITTTTFAPRAARKAKAIAKPRPTAVAAAASAATAVKDGSASILNGQDDFRALVAAKNKQREDKLVIARDGVTGEKRKSELEDKEDTKRSRT
uniref:U4/U6 snRNA-associated-splicing factor PRP24 n=1 Tax=Kwoniella bestiolae CBS 10118 TaxID=1296100 RepID=A0A1B9FZX2_9TREE|nr:hypothetical protein I302_05770 [Kwoniella bestiolae CBS 10118]OCF24311.1 hypothetical protein I302_05770 [Kwoniella bestiolae CBS 10118]